MKNKYLTLCSAICLLLIAACSDSGGDQKKPKAAKEEKPTVQLTLAQQETLAPGKAVTVLAKLTDLKTRSLITDEQLVSVHTQKFHLLVIDPTLTDYQHVHPQATDTPGLYRFTFTPKLAGGYRAWADVTPAASGKQQYVSADLGSPRGGNISKAESYEATAEGYHFTLAFDTPPVVGNPSMGTVHVTKAGKPVTTLEPVMGAFAHVVSFSEDFRTVMHTHPMGREPASATERGGPDLMFHLEPKKAGFVKLFVQVKTGGKDIFAPFGITVKP